MLPDLVAGLLPPGVHWATWDDLVACFGTTPHRLWLLEGLREAVFALAAAGCRVVYIDGSFVTDKALPGDYDLCWDMDGVDFTKLDPVFGDLDPPRAAQKIKFRGDLLPNVVESNSGMPFVDFFQIDKESGGSRGIVALDLRNFAG